MRVTYCPPFISLPAPHRPQSDKAKEKKGGKKKRGAADDATVAAEAVTVAAVPALEEAPTLPSVAEEGEGTAASEITAMLRAKKKRRKQQEEEEMGRAYVAFDPLDWRSKQFG